ncbi:hypothetical protein Droror1_Dr00014364 [Drosera rotundifolia]
MLKNPTTATFTAAVRLPARLYQISQVSSLKVHWRRDPLLDAAILADRRPLLCSKVINEVLNSPTQSLPLHYLEKRRARLKLKLHAKTFISQNPNLFEVYMDRIRPGSELVRFVRPGERLMKFVGFEKWVCDQNEKLIVGKLCKMLRMAKGRVIRIEKLDNVRRVFGFPRDLVRRVEERYGDFVRVCGGGEFLELVGWEEEWGKSVIMARAEEEERATGIRVRPAFEWKLPRGFYIRKEMREWVRDWIEMPYISPYEDAEGLDQASREMEKRTVGVIHELLSLSLLKRIPVPLLGKFGEEYRLSNAFSSVFTRHSGIFYMSLKGGIKTAILREAYRDGVLVDRDPLLVIKDEFLKLLEEGWKERAEELRLRREAGKKDAEFMANANDSLIDEEPMDEEILA